MVKLRDFQRLPHLLFVLICCLQLCACQADVWDPYSMDEPLQTLTAGTDIFLDWSVIDANFDGSMDFACTYLRGNQPYYDHLWIWNEYYKRFDSVPEYDQISMPPCMKKQRLFMDSTAAAPVGQENIPFTNG